MDNSSRTNRYYHNYLADREAAETAESRGNLKGARILYREAALELLNMAELETGETKRLHFQMAEEMKARADRTGKEPAAVPSGGTGGAGTPGSAGGTEGNMWKSEGIPDTSFDDVVGMEDVKQLIRTRVIDQIKYPELYSRFGLKGGTGVLLFGLPGTGKTTIARAIAHEIGAPLYTVQLSDVLSKWVGESQQRIRQLFDAARAQPAALIFFDDFDALGKTRQEEGNGHQNQVIVELINQMDGFRRNTNTIVLLAATNKPWMIDSALMRPGRLEHHIYVPLLNHEARILLVRKTLDSVPADPDLDMDRVGSLLKGYNGADIVSVVKSAKFAALERSKESFRSGENRISAVCYADLAEAAENHRSSVDPRDIAEMRKYAADWDIRLPEDL